MYRHILIPTDGSDTAAKAVGAGTTYAREAGAKVWFILVGVIQQTVLPRIIGMEGYGAFSTVLAISNIPNNIVTTSSIQGVSKAVAGSAGREQAAQRRVLFIHAALAPCLAAVFVALAPLAAEFEHAPHILRPLRIFGCVLFVYALYTPLVGALNGKRRFLAQASLDVAVDCRPWITKNTAPARAIAKPPRPNGDMPLGPAANAFALGS